jgi:hypothetical protein
MMASLIIRLHPSQTLDVPDVLRLQHLETLLLTLTDLVRTEQAR